jgi:prolyl-tRNA synthetase
MECALVTHSRLQKAPDGKGVQPDPASKLEEPLVIRPTSETMFGHMYAQWVQSYRDLPLLINQWCNVMRWEMRTRLFLRTAEFLWQEGHTAHETAEEAQAETLQMLDVYAAFAEEFLAVPVYKGTKTESEKFPGADTTYCIEALMQDGKALQAGTSHNLGQNFSKAFDIKFLGRDQKQQHVWTTSWGVSTRLIGAMIMAHSDDEGLVIPPKAAPTVAAIVPIFKSPEEQAKVREFITKVLTQLVGEGEVAAGQQRAKRSRGGEIESYFFNTHTNQSVVVDWRDTRPGDKQYHWEQRGVPFRLEVGPRDVDAGAFVLKQRLDRGKATVALAEVSASWLREKLDQMHAAMFDKARQFRDQNTRRADTYDQMKEILEKQGGFVRAWFKPSVETEAKIKDETKATVRCIPFDQPGGKGKCIYSGEETATEVLFAVAY